MKAAGIDKFGATVRSMTLPDPRPLAPDEVLIGVVAAGVDGVTGAMIAALALLRGIRVIATAGPTSTQRLKRLGVETVFDYHDRDWPGAVLALTEGVGVAAAVNAAGGGEAATLSAVADGGRFATITGAPPRAERRVSIADVYVEADGAQLEKLAGLLGQRDLEVPIAAVDPLVAAADALALVTHRGARGAVVLEP
jgi:NADPH:quinone reductase-like Zn-dependent oxidoreductase